MRLHLRSLLQVSFTLTQALVAVRRPGEPAR